MSVGGFVLTALALGGVLWFLVPFGLRKMQTRQLESLCRTTRAVVLTYDDGPSTDVSPRLLDLLRSQDAPATFFVVGRNARDQRDTISRLKQDGHEIGGHTQNHTNAWKVAPWRAISDIHEGQDTLATLGAPSRLYRPTFGKTSLATLVYGLIKGLRYVYWTVDTRDSWDRRPISDVLAELDEKGGGVVLMHDFDAPTRGPAPAQHADYVLQTTQAIIAHSRKNGMTLCRFTDLQGLPRHGVAAQ